MFDGCQIGTLSGSILKKKDLYIVNLQSRVGMSSRLSAPKPRKRASRRNGKRHRSTTTGFFFFLFLTTRHARRKNRRTEEEREHDEKKREKEDETRNIPKILSLSILAVGYGMSHDDLRKAERRC